MNPKPIAQLLNACWLLPSLLFLIGCATTNPYSISVNIDPKVAPSSPDRMTYAILYGSDLSRELLEPQSEQVHAALSELGYKSVNPEDASVAIYLMTSINEIGTKTRRMSHKEAGVPMNPDSIRFKNLAAMVGRGRYTELLNDNPNAPGNVIMGPEGEVIATGNLRDTSQPELPMIEEPRRINRLVVSALEAPFPPDPKDIAVRWKVEAISDLAMHKPSPSMEVLLEAALSNLLE